MSTLDTSSDDATLASFENSIPWFYGDGSPERKVLAIARRLQGEVASHARCHRDTAAHIDKLEAEVRELRATIARVGDQLRGIAPIIRVYRSPAKYDHAHVNRVLEAVIADTKTGDKT